MKNQFLRILLFLLAGLNTSAFAWTLAGSNSSLKGFDTDELIVTINTTNCPANIESMVNNALELWNSVPSSRLKISLEGYSTTTAASLHPITFSFADTAVITCSNDFDTDLGEVGIKDGAAGVGFGGAPSGSDQNRIVKAAMILNVDAGGSQNINNLSTKAIEAIIAHEFGHMLGIGHSDNPKALMYYSSSRESLALDQDDIDAITFLYPRNEFGQDGFFGCGLVESVAASIAAGQGGPKLPPPGTSAALVFSLLLPLLLLALLKRQSKERPTRMTS